MKVQEIKDQGKWDTFFAKAGAPSFLQSWEWGEFNTKGGYDCVRLGVFDASMLVAQAMVVTISSKRGRFRGQEWGW